MFRVAVLDVAAPILKAANFPSLFFINPGIVTAEVLPLDNLLSFAVEELTLDRVLVLLNQNHSNIRSLSQLINRLIPIINPADLELGRQRIYSELKVTEIELYKASNLFLKEHDIKKLLSHGVDIGNHSMNKLRTLRALARNSDMMVTIEHRLESMIDASCLRLASVRRERLL